MDMRIRPATADDVDACGRICFEGYKAVYESHGFSAPFATVAAATGRVRSTIENPAVFGVVAETGGAIAGFNFLTELDPVRAVGPIVVDPNGQGRGAGRLLMEAALERAGSAGSVRLVQAAFNMQSMSLYAKLGFEIREPLVVMAGRPEPPSARDYEIRRMVEADLPECEALHERIHGFTRTNELRDRLAARTPVVALRAGRVASYLASPTVMVENHGVAESEEAMRAVLAGAAELADGPVACLVPIRHAALFRWCLDAGMQARTTHTLMTLGDYDSPRGSYIPSILY